MHHRIGTERQRALPPEHLTELQRAVRFLYLQRLAFGGKVEGRNFGVSPGQAARFNVLRLERDIAELHERLAGVVIEQLDFAKRRASNNFQLASRIDARQRELSEEKRLVEQMLR